MDVDIAKLLVPLLIVGLRVSGVIMFAPLFGSAAIPARMKAALIIVIVWVMLPVYGPHLAVSVGLDRWPLVVGSELLVGVGLGIASNVVFEAAQMAGQVLSVQMGYSLINILDPQTNVDTTVVSAFHQTVAMLIFLGLDVHHWILRAIGKSFEYAPPGAITANVSFTQALLQSAGTVLEVGIQIAAPVLAATLVADVVLGLLGKASPQMPLMLLGPAFKSVLGLLVLGASLKYWPRLFEHYFGESIGYTERLLHLAR